MHSSIPPEHLVTSRSSVPPGFVKPRTSRPPPLSILSTKPPKLLGLSDLYLPFPSLKNPHAEEAERTIKAVGRRVGLIRNELDEDYFDTGNKISAFTYPHANLDRLMACIQWCDWLFLFDDRCDTDTKFMRDEASLGKAMESYISLLRNGSLPPRSSPLVRFTLDFRNRLTELATPVWLARFVSSVEEYLLKGVLETAKNFRIGDIPNLQSYLTTRNFDSGVMTAIDMIELATGFELSEDIISHHSIQRMRQLCNQVLAYVNDIVSYQKEVLLNKNPNNLIHVLISTESCTFDEAVSTLVETVNANVSEFLELRKSLSIWMPSSNTGLDKYLDGMQHWMRGNLDFCLESGRYCSRESPFPELRKPISVIPPPPDSRASV